MALLSVNAFADCKKVPIKIAVIDTGFGYMDRGHGAKLCLYGHKDFSNENRSTTSYGTISDLPLDTHSHGTNIAGIIDGYMANSGLDYCIVVIKYYSEMQTGAQNLDATARAIHYAVNLKVDFINYSGGGPDFSRGEYRAMKRAEKSGIKFIAAAGNEHKDIDQEENYYYPAAYRLKNIVTVGNWAYPGVINSSSNFGSNVNRWEIGTNVTAYGITMSGTSQATAVATGKIASESKNKCDIGAQ